MLRKLTIELLKDEEFRAKVAEELCSGSTPCHDHTVATNAVLDAAVRQLDR